MLVFRAQVLLAQQQRDMDRPQELERHAQQAERGAGRLAERRRKQKHLQEKAEKGETIVKTEGNDENFKDYKPNKLS